MHIRENGQMINLRGSVSTRGLMVKEDKIDGKGSCTLAVDWRLYVGEWITDMRNGRGILSFAASRIFEGLYKDDFRGSGLMIDANGVAFKASFNE